jgi:hypothetical protein
MATGDLCQVADVKAFLSITGSTDDTLLQTLVTNASAFVNNYINRNLLSADYVETRNGLGSDRIAFRQYPVSAVASLVVDGCTILPPVSPHGFGYLFDDTMLYLRNGFFPRGVQNVVISYTAGFAVVPADVSQATVEIVATKYKRRTDLHVSGKTLNGETISFTMADVPASAKVTLNSYQCVYRS